MGVAGASRKIHESVMAYPGVTAHRHRYGGVEYRLGNRELGHVHPDFQVDLPFPVRVRKELVAEGLASLHHLLPESGWVTLYLREPGDLEKAIELFRRSTRHAKVVKACWLIRFALCGLFVVEQFLPQR
jgi:luciferase-like monooxygenase